MVQWLTRLPCTQKVRVRFPAKARLLPRLFRRGATSLVGRCCAMCRPSEGTLSRRSRVQGLRSWTAHVKEPYPYVEVGGIRQKEFEPTMSG